MLTMFIRALILYLSIILIIRVTGKRQVGQLQPFELVFTIIIADLAASPMSNVGVPLFYGIMPIAALLLCYGTISILCLKSERVRAFLCGRPSVLVRNGVIDQKEMENQCFSLTELLERVRGSGVLNVHEISSAVLEVSGQLSVFPNSQKRAVTPEDMQLPTEYESLPLNLVLDGRVQSETLHFAGFDEKWLQKCLKDVGTQPKAVYYCALDTAGLMTVQLFKSSRLLYFNALTKEEVKW